MKVPKMVLTQGLFQKIDVGSSVKLQTPAPVFPLGTQAVPTKLHPGTRNTNSHNQFSSLGNSFTGVLIAYEVEHVPLIIIVCPLSAVSLVVYRTLAQTAIPAGLQPDCELSLDIFTHSCRRSHTLHNSHRLPHQLLWCIPVQQLIELADGIRHPCAPPRNIW